MDRMTPKKSVEYLGIKNNKLSQCPQSMKNCVCSEYQDNFFIQPLTCTHKNPIKLIKDAIIPLKGYKLVAEKNDYLHFTFTSAVFKFVDDIEFRIEKNNDSKTIHIRSASKLGYWDLGANRKRVHELFTLLRSRANS